MQNNKIRYFLIYLIGLFSFSIHAVDTVDCDDNITYSLPSGNNCESDFTTCFTELICYITQEDLVNDDSFITIKGGEQHFNQLFWHGKYIETLISQDNYDAFSQLQDASNEMLPLVEGTLIIKHSISSDEDDITILDSNIGNFIMYKPIGGYCPDDHQLSDGECSTGDWIFASGVGYDSETDEYRSVPIVSTGKPEKCISCHASASRTDSVFNLFISRKYGSVAE